MNARPSSVVAEREARRGVLLLVVLSMLTLFLMLGAAYLVSATRAREAARAYARLTFAGDEARVPHARLLDGVFLRVLRGGAAPTATGTTPDFESLLADKYGTTSLSGTATGFGNPGPGVAVIETTVTLTSATTPSDLNGRVISFVEPGRPVTTHRIIRAETPGGGNVSQPAVSLAIGAASRPGPFVRPKAPSRVVVNGREFDGSTTNEPWDGFDGRNPFLAQVGPGTTISRSSVSRISYFPDFPVGTLSATLDRDSDLIPDAADNDNDGVYDGLFMDFGIPDARDASGNAVNVRASVLIVDLDGRFNVNAHDGLMRTIYTGTVFAAGSGTNPNWSSTVPLGPVPLGTGYGPAEVSAAHLFVTPLNPSGTFQDTEQPRLFPIAGGRDSRSLGKRVPNSRYSANEDTQRLGAMEGRYGEAAPSQWTNLSGSNTRISTMRTGADFARPGIPGTDDDASRIVDRRAVPSEPATVSYGIPAVWWTGTSDFDWRSTGVGYPLPRGVFNSPPDLHGRMKTLTLSASNSALVPSVAFAQPEWSTATAQNETRDDPYELRLDTRLGFGGLLFDPTAGGTATSASSIRRDNPFTAAELEPVVRPYDIDTNRLPPRLPAMLGSAGEEARLKVTTDSWDTTAITGEAAVRIANAVRPVTSGLYGTSAITGVINGEVARGERFDLNRPLAAADGSNVGYPAAGALASGTYHAQRAAYCKDLYTLLIALSGTNNADDKAQWVANVAEFRDGDSRVVPFEYDPDPFDNESPPDGDTRTDEGVERRRVAWGAERPEIVIREVFAWRNSNSGSSGMVITLHRPWNATAYGTGSTTAIAGEPCDYALDSLSGTTSGRPLNAVNLGKKPGSHVYDTTYTITNALDVSQDKYPIWRLRIVTTTGTQFVAFTGTSPHWIGAPSITSGAQSPKMAADSSFTVFTGTAIMTGTIGGSGTVFVAPPAGSLAMPTLTLAANSPGTVYLERLSDPTIPLTAASNVSGLSVTGSTIWLADPAVATSATNNTWHVAYVVVDEMPLQVVETQASTTLSATWNVRGTSNANTAFWAEKTTDDANRADGQTLVCPSPLNAGSTAWLPWPNRPFVSSAELLLVPQGNASRMLQDYRRLTPDLAGSVGPGRSIPVATELLFDAVHVPTRFAGIHGTTTQDLSAATGIFNMVTPVNQLSSFREPGRVNLNTVLADDVWNAVVAGPLPSPVRPWTSWRAAAITSGTPARSTAAALALSGGDSGTVVSDTTAPQRDVNLNPLHEIYTATRLANTVTPRSNVFAVWITLQESVPNDPDSVRYRRAFYIVDRSIPVAFENGRDTNVWDCVRVRRIIE